MSVYCPYCNKKARFTSSKKFYGRDFGTNIYFCKRCDARVGTHGRGKRPVGTMANAELRNWRMTAHSIFDPIWKGKGKLMTRSEAYVLMQKLMDMSPKEAHIGMMDKKQVLKLIERVKEYRKKRGHM